MPVELYGYRYSVYSWIARLVLEEKGVGYRWIEADPFADDVPKFYLALHPFKRVPALVHDGFQLYETAAITRYLDEAFPGPRLQSADPRVRARSTQIISIVDSYAYWPLVRQVFSHRVVGAVVAQTSSWAERLPQSAARGYPGTREPELPDVGEGIPVVPSVENDSIVCRVVNDGVEVADPWTLPHVIHRRPRRRSGEIEDPRVVEKVSVVAAEHHHSLPDGVIDGGVTVPGRWRSPRGREKFPGSGTGEAQGPDVVVEDAVVVAAENQDAVLYWIVDRSVAVPTHRHGQQPDVVDDGVGQPDVHDVHGVVAVVGDDVVTPGVVDGGSEIGFKILNVGNVRPADLPGGKGDRRACHRTGLAALQNRRPA